LLDPCSLDAGSLDACSLDAGLLDPCSAPTTPSSIHTVLTAASPDVFRNVRLLGPFEVCFDM
jgi:hypothetical protein